MNSTFEPMRLQPYDLGKPEKSHLQLTLSTTIRGQIVEDLEKLQEEYGLNRSQLLRQMIYHCLGKTEELKEFYKRMSILGE